MSGPGEALTSIARNHFIKAMLLSTVMTPLGGAGVAHAQEATTPEAAGALGEVVVTARRRAENLQDTPVSVTAISGEEAAEQNIRNFQDLRGAVSNLEVLPLATGGASFTIRGIGQTNSQVNVDTKAGFYVDEMYVARQEGNQLYFYDVDSLQVLKGPQGTLFGKNTTAGAVLLSTRRPTADTGGYLLGRVGSYKRLDAEGAINIPVSDALLTRFSFRTQNADGYIKHVLDEGESNNVNDKSARFQIRALPDSKLTIDLLGEYNQSNTDGSTSIVTGCRPTAAYMRNYNALHSIPLCTAYPILNKDYAVYGGATLSIPTSSAITDIAKGGDSNGTGRTRGGHRESFNDTEVATVNLRMNYDFNDNISLKSITAYRHSDSSWYNPTINAPNDIYAELDDTSTDQFTQEVNLNGKAIDGRMNYVLGLFYYHQKTGFVQDTGPDWIDPIGYTYDADNKFESWAAYAQASFKFTDALELTLGGRYSYDRKKASSDVFLQTIYTTPQCRSFVAAFQAGAAACGGHFVGSGKDSWESFDPRAQLSYAWTPDLFTYVSVTRGYNAGGFNQQLGSNLGGILVSYDPEKVTSYEAGLKSEWFDRRLRVNVAAFYQDYADIQTTVLININGVDTRQVQTGATAHEQGFEGELVVQPVPELVLRANGSYLDQAYDSIRPGVSFTLNTPVNTAPKYTYSVSGNYTFYLPSDSTLTASLNWRAVGRKPACNPIGSCYTPGYGLLGGRLDFQPGEDSPWSIGIFGTNLLDKKVELSRNRGGSMGIDSYIPGRPIEFGLEITRKF
ncbi:TonB-dependent receptor [Sphingomonas oleivorans]|uniref:TonB-dependent receptor n=1 Tax=Sphingomonas oleivorans TaxID=1735121 RepID=A0A2T5G0N1_9SPHN|nr:TonB-dependent receptor [Sphingomonas oleivorans]PTQ12716.1 TonB-dependent receptor [Sphingomonas oleivorans]